MRSTVVLAFVTLLSFGPAAAEVASSVVFELHETESISLVVGIIADEPDPFVTVRTTNYTADLDPAVETESGHLWVTWIDDPTHVGWSVYSWETRAWSSPAFISIEGSSVAAARSGIRTMVLGE